MRRWFWLGLVVATAVVSASSSVFARQSTPLSVQDAVARYATGDFDAAVRGLDTGKLTVAAFTRALDAWIEAGGPAVRPRRRLVSAAFALDAVWAVTRSPWDARGASWIPRAFPTNRIPPVSPEREALVSPNSSAPLVASWAIQQLPSLGSPDTLERRLWLTAVGIAEDDQAWHLLQDEILPVARKRLAGEPRLALADVLVRTNIELRMLHASLARRFDVLREESLPSSVTGRIPGAIRAFEALLADSTLAGEVELRIGYLELRRKRWPAALTRFDAARSKATEPILVAITNYFGGWVHEQEGRRDDAIDSYRRALAITPLMRNLATRLSALLYLRNDRAEAHAVLDAALNAEPVPVDLLIVLDRADARFVPEWIESIRKALK